MPCGIPHLVITILSCYPAKVLGPIFLDTCRLLEPITEANGLLSFLFPLFLLILSIFLLFIFSLLGIFMVYPPGSGENFNNMNIRRDYMPRAHLLAYVHMRRLTATIPPFPNTAHTLQMMANHPSFTPKTCVSLSLSRSLRKLTPIELH